MGKAFGGFFAGLYLGEWETLALNTALHRPTLWTTSSSSGTMEPRLSTSSWPTSTRKTPASMWTYTATPLTSASSTSSSTEVLKAASASALGSKPRTHTASFLVTQHTRATCIAVLYTPRFSVGRLVPLPIATSWTPATLFFPPGDSKASLVPSSGTV